MLFTALSALTLIAATAAQSVTQSASASSSNALSSGATTVSVFVPGADAQPIVASVISANASVTAYHINCAPGTDSSDCGIGPGANITVSSRSVVDFTITIGSSLKFNYLCTVQGSAICAETSSRPNGLGVTIETIPQASVTSLPVVVTAGAEKLIASGSTSRTASGSVSGTASGSASRAASASGAVNSSSSGNSGASMNLGNAIMASGFLSIIFRLM